MRVILTMLVETLQKLRFTYLELFVALHQDGQFSLSQDGVMIILGQICDQLTLTVDAAFTIGNQIRRRSD